MKTILSLESSGQDPVDLEAACRDRLGETGLEILSKARRSGLSGGCFIGIFVLFFMLDLVSRGTKTQSSTENLNYHIRIWVMFVTVAASPLSKNPKFRATLQGNLLQFAGSYDFFGGAGGNIAEGVLYKNLQEAGKLTDFGRTFVDNLGTSVASHEANAWRSIYQAFRGGGLRSLCLSHGHPRRPHPMSAEAAGACGAARCGEPLPRFSQWVAARLAWLKSEPLKNPGRRRRADK